MQEEKNPAVPDSHRLGVEPGRVVLSPLSLEMDEHKQMLLCKTNIIRKQDYLAVNVFDVCLSFSLFFFFLKKKRIAYFANGLELFNESASLV